MKAADRPPPTLREAQQWMASRILHPERFAGEALARMVAEPPRGHRRERLNVYINGYPARVQEAVEESFPAVMHLIGHRPSHALVARYASALRRHSYNLNDIGAELPDFLRQDEITGQFPFLPDLARLEWAIVRAFHAHNRPPLDLQPLATWTDEQWHHAVLQFHPSVALVCSAWPVRTLWEVRDTPIEAIDVDLRDRPDQVIVYRIGHGVRCASICRDEALALGTLLAGHTLGHVSELLSAHDGDPSSVAAWFARWMQNQLIVSCTTDRCSL